MVYAMFRTTTTATTAPRNRPPPPSPWKKSLFSVQQQQQQPSISLPRGSSNHHHNSRRPLSLSLLQYISLRRIVIIILTVLISILCYVYVRIITLHIPTTTTTTTITTTAATSSRAALTAAAAAAGKMKPSIIQAFVQKLTASQSTRKEIDPTTLQQNVYYFRQIAIELSKYNASDILYELNTYDPFGVRTVIRQIQTAEIQNNNNQSLSLSQLKSFFQCPPIAESSSQQQQQQQHRITFPDLRNMTKLALYQQQIDDITHADSTNVVVPQPTGNNYFIYFQHLRKAGGTHFCTMAQQNIPAHYVPTYYCMPDYYWKPPESYSRNSNQQQQQQQQQRQYQSCAGCLHRYSNTEIIKYMQNYKIAGNEWDNFNVPYHFQLPAIYMTSFRQPLHRFVSQYRFECVEDRGCTAKNIDEYWNRRRDLYNIYTSTFSDINQQASFASVNTKAASQRRSDAITIAFDTIVQFHLVLVMELLPYSEQLVQNILRFHDTSILSKRVRPHNSGKNYRTDSWTPEQYLNTEQYTKMSESLALDEILYDVARRLFLERLVCSVQ